MAQLDIQSGTVNKTNSGARSVSFPTPFSSPPTVVVSSFWKNPTQIDVGAVETITSISQNGFTISSANQSSSYYVTWIAVGS